MKHYRIDLVRMKLFYLPELQQQELSVSHCNGEGTANPRPKQWQSLSEEACLSGSAGIPSGPSTLEGLKGTLRRGFTSGG